MNDDRSAAVLRELRELEIEIAAYADEPGLAEALNLTALRLRSQVESELGDE